MRRDIGSAPGNSERNFSPRRTHAPATPPVDTHLGHTQTTRRKTTAPPRKQGRSLTPHEASRAAARPPRHSTLPPHALGSHYMHRTQPSPHSRRGLHVLMSTTGTGISHGRIVPQGATETRRKRSRQAKLTAHSPKAEPAAHTHTRSHASTMPSIAPARVTSLHLRSCQHPKQAAHTRPWMISGRHAALGRERHQHTCHRETSPEAPSLALHREA